MYAEPHNLKLKRTESHEEYIIWLLYVQSLAIITEKNMGYGFNFSVIMSLICLNIKY